VQGIRGGADLGNGGGEGAAGPGQPRGDESSEGHGWRSSLGAAPGGGGAKGRRSGAGCEVRKTLVGGGGVKRALVLNPSLSAALACERGKKWQPGAFP